MRRKLFNLTAIVGLLLAGVLTVMAQDQPAMNPEDDPNAYVVQRGDALERIAARYDVQLFCLARANRIPDPNRIYIGQVLFIDLSCPHYDGVLPVENPRSDMPVLPQPIEGGNPPIQGVTYVLKYGDVFDLIAQQYDVSLDWLLAANGLERNYALLYVQPGMVLTIPAGAPPYGSSVPPGEMMAMETGSESTDAMETAAPEATEEPAMEAATPEPADETVVTDDEAAANQAAEDVATQGVGAAALDEALYRVEEGDTLASIAEELGLRMEDLAAANQIPEDAELEVGALLIVPQG